MNKVQEFLASHAYACDVCGVTADQLLLGSTDSKGRRLSMRSVKHAARLRHILTVGLDMSKVGINAIEKLIDATLPATWALHLFTSTSSEAAREGLVWFNANPARTYRVRPTLEGEDGFGELHQTVVRREKSGFRRIPIPNDFEVPDQGEYAQVLYELWWRKLAEMFEEHATAKVQGKYLDIDELAAYVATLRVSRWMA